MVCGFDNVIDKLANAYDKKVAHKLESTQGNFYINARCTMPVTDKAAIRAAQAVVAAAAVAVAAAAPVAITAAAVAQAAEAQAAVAVAQAAAIAAAQDDVL